ncbi:hypothetical protein AMJ80_04070 [bacterium SM23_31]|nr:MAG: hypothetical protein AMJ80_04070 [bacterium SM23_31]
MQPDIRQEIIKSIKKLPTLPIIFEKILETVDDPRSSANELQEIIKNDQSITAKILNMANSAYYGYSKRVSSLSRAVVILGFDMVKNIALSVSVFSMFPYKNEKSYFNKEQFWLHAIACGYLGKMIAERTNYYEPDKAFIACLLHDIGKVVLDSYFEDDYSKAIQIKAKENISIREAEEKVIDLNHTEVGYFLGEKWDFPDELLSAIRYHHFPAEAPQQYSSLTYLTYLTNIVCQEERIGEGGSVLPVQIEPQTFAVLKLKDSHLELIRQDIQDLREKLETMIQAIHL